MSGKKFDTKEEILQAIQDEVKQLPALELEKNELSNEKAVKRQKQIKKIIAKYQPDWDRIESGK